MAVTSMAAGDPRPYPLGSYWTEHSGWVPVEHPPMQNDFSSIEMADIRRRLEQLETIMLQDKHEQQVRDDNPFVRELYEQYKVALVLVAEPDDG